MTTRTTDEIAILIAPVLEKYSLSADAADGRLVLRNKKQVAIATISADGSIERKKIGMQVLMGALIRNELAFVLR